MSPACGGLPFGQYTFTLVGYFCSLLRGLAIDRASASGSENPCSATSSDGSGNRAQNDRDDTGGCEQ